MNKIIGTNNMPIDLENMSEKDTIEFVTTILKTATKEGLEFLK